MINTLSKFKGEEMTINYLNNELRQLYPYANKDYDFNNSILRINECVIKFNVIGGFVGKEGYFGNTVIKILDVVQELK
jgi:hypothetical protein